MVVLKYGTFWRDTRRALQPFLHPQAIHRFRDIHVRTTHELLGDLLSTPRLWVSVTLWVAMAETTNLADYSGAVHVSTQDDAYRGYHIPKGTYVLPNSW